MQASVQKSTACAELFSSLQHELPRAQSKLWLETSPPDWGEKIGRLLKKLRLHIDPKLEIAYHRLLQFSYGSRITTPFRGRPSPGETFQPQSSVESLVVEGLLGLRKISEAWHL